MTKMNCCNQNPVIIPPAGEKLCKMHFMEYFENKVFKTITKFNLIEKKENMGVAISGGKDSLTLLHILNKLSKQNPKIKLTAILIDEGIKGYRDKTIKTAKKFCSKNKIKLNIYSYEKEFGIPLDKMLKALNAKPCTLCGIFRRYLLNKKSKELGFTKLATGHNLDDECQSILMNQFKNNLHLSARLGPMVGINNNKNNSIKNNTINNKNNKLNNDNNSNINFVQRIKPVYLCAEKETTIYAFSNNLLDSLTECHYVSESYRAQVRNMLNDFEAKFPGTKHGIVNSFLGILQDLKERFSNGKANFCKICGEAAARDKCNACKYIEKIKKAVE